MHSTYYLLIHNFSYQLLWALDCQQIIIVGLVKKCFFAKLHVCYMYLLTWPIVEILFNKNSFFFSILIAISRYFYYKYH
jgi:hypothetical protein